ncbi:MAG: YdcF family protein [Defluviitaleaceae bacterium]|nr:YdcF family protein [Defluviitaleaceae bacterium]
MEKLSVYQKKLFEDISKFIFVNDAPVLSDVIFLPGGTYPEAAERAARLWKAGYAPLIAPSGKYYALAEGFGGVKSKAEIYGENFSTEWEFFRHVLLANGVDERGIVPEKEAGTTCENAKFTRKMLDGMGVGVKRAIICCKSYHARRALMYYQYYFPEAELRVCPADISGINRDNWYLTEKGIKAVMGEMRKCGGQFEVMYGGVSQINGNGK